MKSLCILTPAIVDRECVEITSKLLYENLFSLNPDVHFDHVVQLCNHTRPECVGSVDEIEEIYNKYNDLNNVTVKVNKSYNRLGHVMAGYYLYKEFLETDCDYCLLIEDDIKLANPLYVKDLNLVVEKYKDNIIHLSAGYDYPGLNEWKGDPGKEDCSSEAWLEDKIDEIENINIYTNCDTFCSWNGNLLSRDMVKNIVENFQPLSTVNCEDQISRMSHYRSFDILTLGYGEGIDLIAGRKDFNIHYDWQLPKQNHYLLETTRRARTSGRPGYLG